MWDINYYKISTILMHKESDIATEEINSGIHIYRLSVFKGSFINIVGRKWSAQ